MLHNLIKMMTASAMEISGGGLAEMSVLDRQRAHTKWQQQPLMQQQMLTNYFNGADDQLMMTTMFSPLPEAQEFHSLDDVMAARAMKPENVWSDFSSVGLGEGTGFGIDCTISRTASCPPAVAAAVAEDAISVEKRKEMAPPEKPSSTTATTESSKKRKADKSLKAVEEKETGDKKQSKIEQSGNKKTTTNKKKESSTATSNETEDKKPDYIHVRARRGQATDSHSLAERVRREKISERMKHLQDLVPGCNKITGKAGMLDEIINYVQSLQRQVEFLSMKLATVNPTLDFNIDSFYTKEVFEASGGSTGMIHPSYPQFYSLPQCSGLETGANPSAMALRRTISAPISVNQLQSSSTWDEEIQNLYAMEFQQGRTTSFPLQPFMGFVEGGNTGMAI